MIAASLHGIIDQRDTHLDCRYQSRRVFCLEALMAVHRAEGYWSIGIDFLAAGNYIAVNRSLIKVFGLEGAVLIGELASEAKYWNDRDTLEDGWFFSTIENVEGATGLSGYQQRKALSELTKAGVMETAQKGIPKKRYIRIHFMELVNLVNDKSLKNFTTVGEETSPLEEEKLNVNNYKEQLKPTITKNNESIPFSEIINYLNEKAVTRYRTSAKKTQAHIRARWNEGYRLGDFKRVVDVKCAEWIGTEFERYLCPDTLFGPKFEKYVNQPMPKSKGDGVKWDAELSEYADEFDF